MSTRTMAHAPRNLAKGQDLAGGLISLPQAESSGHLCDGPGDFHPG